MWRLNETMKGGLSFAIVSFIMHRNRMEKKRQINKRREKRIWTECHNSFWTFLFGWFPINLGKTEWWAYAIKIWLHVFDAKSTFFFFCFLLLLWFLLFWILSLNFISGAFLLFYVFISGWFYTQKASQFFVRLNESVFFWEYNFYSFTSFIWASFNLNNDGLLAGGRH